MGARERILQRVRQALKGRPKAELPPPGPPESPREDPLELFLGRLGDNGARGQALPRGQALAFLQDLLGGEGVALGEGVPEDLRLGLRPAPPEEATWGLSWALFGVAETGSVALASWDGRRAQLLPPRHLVLLERDRLFPTLLEALAHLEDLPPALGLHSGPSKSADIGQVTVRGVHGPGELWVLVLT